MAASGNFNVYNPNNVQGPAGPGTFAGELGNTGGDTSSGSTSWVGTTFGLTSGKWYFEVRKSGATGGWPRIGFYSMGLGGSSLAYVAGETDNALSSIRFNQGDDTLAKYVFGSTSSSTVAGSISDGDILQVAVDIDNGKIWYGVNNTYLVSGDPAGDSNPIDDYTEATYNPLQVCVGTYNTPDLPDINFGQDSTFRGQRSAGNNADGNGRGDFAYAPPSGFLAICAANLPIDANIDPGGDDGDTENSTKQFNCVAYTGTGTSNAVTGLGFQPDLVVIKNRSGTQGTKWTNTTRGATKVLQSATTSGESTDTGGVTAFGTDGFTVGTDAGYNGSTNDMIAWCWRANGGTTSTNTSGTITSTVQANTKGGFSIITYTGTGTNSTIGHGLTKAPDFYIVKNASSGTENWTCYHAGITETHYLTFNTTAIASDNNTFWNDTAPTSTVISLGTNARCNGSTNTMVGFAWHSVEGYSKFDKWEANANNNGSFVYTGFRPRLVFIKSADTVAPWVVWDTERSTSNKANNALAWNASSTEADYTGYPIDFHANGFKLRTSNATVNAAGTWVFGAWGDVPFKYNNVF